MSRLVFMLLAFVFVPALIVLSFDLDVLTFVVGEFFGFAFLASIHYASNAEW